MGRGFRFATDFFLTKDRCLVVKGYGDPFLISEELAVAAKAIKQNGLDEISCMILDTSYFAPDIAIDGTSGTPNPYDALNGALIANFNTVSIHKTGSGPRAKIVSAEPQTPLTPLAMETAKNLRPGRQRVNIGRDPLKGARYVGELLTEFLRKEGIVVRGGMQSGLKPDEARLLYRHASSRRLEEILRELLNYSTNFMANQLFLVMGAERFGAPATVEKGQRALEEFLSQKVGWRDFKIFEGAGLSRQNSVTPRQMISLLRYFEPNRDLLPKEEGIFWAKTGTLTGVNTLAGYFPLNGSGRWARFVIFVNDRVPFDYKFRVAKMLYAGLSDRP